MLVTYVTPNRAHHYNYALALARGGNLQRFVCGASRFSPRASLPELSAKLLRTDHLQNIYLASQKAGMPSAVSEELAYLSKIWLDVRATKDALKSDAFVCYSGAGLRTLSAVKSTLVVGIVEAVNSHVLTQQDILREEHERLGLPMKGFLPREVSRRVKEYELADGIVCPSTFAKRSFVERGFSPDRIRTVPFGIQRPGELEPRDRPDDVFRVLFVGQINLRKGLRYLFEAFEKFRHPKKELWIVGPKTKQTGIEDISPPEGTRFLGVLKGKELAQVYRNCHVFVLPTIEEGLALVMGEALSHGLPVIATLNSGGEDLFENGSNGFLVPIRSPGAITEKLQLLADNPGLLAEMSAWAEARDNGIRNWENASQLFVETLKDFTRMPKL
jgi:starch synthase